MDRLLIAFGTKLTQLRSASALKRRAPDRLGLYRNVAVVLLVVMLLLLLVVLVVKTSSPSPSDRPAAGDAGQECNSVACLQQAAMALSWKNASVQPCVNFYQHVCGSFNVRNPRGGRSKYSISDKLEDFNRRRLQDMLQERSYGDGTAFNKTATLFQSCMNVHDGFQAVQHLVELINTMGGLELFGTWSPERYNLQSTLVQMFGSLKTNSIFNLRLSSQKGLIMYPASFAHYYWKRRLLLGSLSGSADEDGNMTEHDVTLRRNIRIVLQTLPVSNRTCSRSQCLDQMADDVLEMEAKFSRPNSKILEVGVSQLDQVMDEIDWTKLLDQLYGSSYVTSTSTISIPGMSYIEDINDIIKNTSHKKMQHFLMWCLIRDSLPMLGDPFVSFYNQIVTNVFAADPRMKSRSEYCMDTVRLSMPQVTSALFLHAHLDLDSRDAAAALFNDTMRVLLGYSDIFNSSLLSQYRSTSVHFGRVNSLNSTSALDTFYKPLQLNSSTNYFNAIRAVQEFGTARLRQELADHPADAVMTAAADVSHDYVRLRYRQLSSTLLVPFGALQPPWFSSQLPWAVNTAALGSMILQTLFRTLDEAASRTSRGERNQINTAFSRYQTCVNESFSKLQSNDYEPSIFLAALHISLQSETPLSEHFALRSSWKVFNRMTSQYTLLPGLSSLSPQQLFFTAFAQARCENDDPHINSYRDRPYSIEDIINNLMYNDNAFKRAFQCDALPRKYVDKRQCDLSEA